LREVIPQSYDTLVQHDCEKRQTRRTGETGGSGAGVGKLAELAPCAIIHALSILQARAPAPTKGREGGEMCANEYSDAHVGYGVALVSRIDKIIGLFCKRAL